jgi:acetate kinase
LRETDDTLVPRRDSSKLGWWEGIVRTPGGNLVLAVNSGSSSLKIGLFELGETLREIGSIEAVGVGTDAARIRSAGVLEAPSPADVTLSDHDAAIQAVLALLDANAARARVAAAGHRVVHGGRRYLDSWHLIDDEMMQELQRLVPLAPEHLPQAIAGIERFRAAFPSIPHVACFDTSFHRTLTPLARQYPLPHTPDTADIVRYGFHGLSCESVLEQLDPAAALGRLVIAHLGNGSSMTAVRDRKSVETTMGFTPTGGLMMGTRTGDLDPGVLLSLMSAKDMSGEALRRLVNKQSGLKGVSGQTSEMRQLLEDAGPDAANAVALYCYLARKQLAGLIAVLGGIDTLVFTGGIGEHAAPIRDGICADFEFAGIVLDEGQNAAGDPIISAATSTVTVRVVPTDEDRVIARHTMLALQGGVDAI